MVFRILITCSIIVYIVTVNNRFKELTHEIDTYHRNTLAIIEMRWKLFYNMSTDRFISAEKRTGTSNGLFIVHKDMVTAVYGFKHTNLNPLESSSFQYHLHIGLCFNIFLDNEVDNFC